MTFRAFARLLPLAAAFLGLAAGPTTARPQDARAALTAVGGGSTYDDLTPGMDPTVLGSGWLAGVQAEAWLLGGRTAIRLNGQYARRSPETGADVYAVAAGDADLLVRILPVRSGRILAPYIVGGAGATGFFGSDGTPALGAGAYGTDPVIRPHLLVGAGIDLASWQRVGARIEVGDRIVFPSFGESPETQGLPAVHNLMVVAGLQLRLGSLSGGMPARPRPRPRRTPAPVAPPTTPAVEAGRDRVAASGSAEGEADAVPAPQGEDEGRVRPPVSTDGSAAPHQERPVFTVQLGSFVETETAVRWGERLEALGLPVWLIDLEIQGEGVRRIRVGATTAEADARRLAEALEARLGWSTRVDRIGASEAVPPGALDRTRTYLARPASSQP
jgi:hypothetical protein